MSARTMIIGRAVGVMGATAVLATGATWAALASNTVTLQNNTVTSQTADLKLWDGDSWEDFAPGVNITNLVPGTTTAPQKFYFKNAGLPLNLTAHIPVAPAYTGLTNFADMKVHITSLKLPATPPVDTDIAALLAGNVPMPGNPLPANSQGDSGNDDTAGNYSVTFDIAPGAVTGPNVSVSNFNIDFVGVQ